MCALEPFITPQAALAHLEAPLPVGPHARRAAVVHADCLCCVCVVCVFETLSERLLSVGEPIGLQAALSMQRIDILQHTQHTPQTWVYNRAQRRVNVQRDLIEPKQHIPPRLAARRKRPPTDGLAGTACRLRVVCVCMFVCL